MKGGKELGILIEYLVDEQIKDPKLDKEQAIELIKKKKEEIETNINNNNEHYKKGTNKALFKNTNRRKNG